MTKICIIPARGGSKRIPKKNIKDFLGKPIMAYSIEAALSSELFDEVMVSTDDLEIATIAKIYGAKVPFLRSDENASDIATTFDVIKEVIDEYSNKNMTYDFACCIYPCSPFVNRKILNRAFNLLEEGEFDAVFPIIEYSFPIQRAIKLDKKSSIEMFQSEHLNTRSQDLEKSFHDSGQFYWMRLNQIIKKGVILTNNSGGVIIPEMEGQDIDNETDWKLAELKYKLLYDGARK